MTVRQTRCEIKDPTDRFSTVSEALHRLLYTYHNKALQTRPRFRTQSYSDGTRSLYPVSWDMLFVRRRWAHECRFHDLYLLVSLVEWNGKEGPTIREGPSSFIRPIHHIAANEEHRWKV